MKIKFFIPLISILFFAEAFPQTSSSYSRNGIGDMVYSYSARRQSMGDLAISVADFDYVNTLNPAGWNRLSRTRLEFAGFYSRVYLSTNSNSENYGDGAFSGFTFAFPASPLYGVAVAIGLVPYTRVSYFVKDAVQSQAANYNIEYEGDGGLSKLFAGSSYRLPFGMSIGASFDYYFGNVNYISRAQFNSTSTFDSEFRKTYSPRGIGTTVGFISPDFSTYFNAGNITDFRVGAAVNILSSLTTDTIVIGTSSLLTDTISTGSVKMDIPLRVSAGASDLFNTRFMVHINYSYQPWSSYKFNGVSSANLRDAMKISAGFEHRLNKEMASFWEQIFWRAGLSLEQTQYLINGEGINQYSVSAGFSLPLSSESTVDVGAEFSMRGSKDLSLFRENILRLNFGVSLGELWFIRKEK